MRYGRQESKFLLDDNQKLVGISLGWDHVSEHEWGVKNTNNAFGITGSGYGLARRIVHQFPEDRLKWVSGTTKEGKRKIEWSGLVLYRYAFQAKEPLAPPENFYFSRERPLWTGWSDGDFGAFSIDPVQVKYLEEILAALKTNNAAFWLGGNVGNPFANSGFCIGIVDRMDKSIFDAWTKLDREREQLTKDAAATGIADRLKKADKRYFALAPRRKEDGTVIFFLNPFEQHRHNSGWFTVEELDQWIQGKGPVIK